MCTIGVDWPVVFLFYFPEDSSNEEEGQETPAARNIQFFCSDASDRYAPENQPDYPVYFDILTPAGLCLPIIRPFCIMFPVVHIGYDNPDILRDTGNQKESRYPA